MSDYVSRKGAAAFGTRLRRLSERVDREVQELYRSHGVDFEPRWFPVVVALDELGPLSVGSLARRIRVSHAAVSQVRGRLVERGMVRVSPDATDQRRQILALTAKGRAGAKRVRPIWKVIAAATRDLCSEGAPRLLDELDGLEAALDRWPLKDRVLEMLARNPQRSRSRIQEIKDKENKDAEPSVSVDRPSSLRAGVRVRRSRPARIVRRAGPGGGG